MACQYTKLYFKDIKQLLHLLQQYGYPQLFLEEAWDQEQQRKKIELHLHCLLQKVEVEENPSFFLDKMEVVFALLETDLQAAFDGDPACNSREEILLTYPGFFAVFTHRFAHLLYEQNIPLLPRMLSEYAHTKTGIDIHPGATIGPSFFIDHGTGVVIGETTTIGQHVRIYQGVTLGALSLREGQKLKGTKRHPTILDRVIIYAGASILGGQTVIGNDVTIGSNVFLTESVDDHVTVVLKKPDLQYRAR